MAALLSSMASSMLTSITWAPFSTCWRATASACSNSPARIMRAKALEPVTLVRSPMLTNRLPGAMDTGSRPDSFIGGTRGDSGIKLTFGLSCGGAAAWVSVVGIPKPDAGARRCNAPWDTSFYLQGARAKSRLCHLIQECPCRATPAVARSSRSAPLSAWPVRWPLPAAAQSAGSQSPIRILVGFPPGGGTDAIARTLAEKLKDQLGQPVVVDNRAGAGGQIAAQALKAAAPDGQTLFLSHDHTISILPLVTRNPGFEPARDFVAVAGFATFVNAFALSGGTPARSLPEYIQWVRTSQGGKGNVGVPAPASVPEFLVKLIGQKYAVDLQAAPYRGSAPMMADMLGNQIGAGVGSIPDFIENHKAGKIHVVAVMGTARQAAVPDAPTFKELGLAGLRGRALLRPVRARRHAAGRDRSHRRCGGQGGGDARREDAHRHGPHGGLHAAAAAGRPRARLHAGLVEDHQGERLPAAVRAPTSRPRRPAGGDPRLSLSTARRRRRAPWIPAFAGMTRRSLVPGRVQDAALRGQARSHATSSPRQAGTQGFSACQTARAGKAARPAGFPPSRE